MNLQFTINNLNKGQKQAVLHDQGPAAVMAGAGSGKTHTLTVRMAKLISDGIKPSRILMLTFTNQAANEMSHRAAKMLGVKDSGVTACTYHKFCNMMLRRFGEFYLGLKSYSLLSSGEAADVIQYAKNSVSRYKEYGGLPKANTIQAIYSYADNAMIGVAGAIAENDRWDKYIGQSAQLETLRKIAADRRKAEGLLTYDDLLIYMDKLMDTAAVPIIAGMFDYIMIDEYQDTNRLQEKIIVKLAQYNKNIMAVGDVSQSIYGFRAADAQCLQRFAGMLGGVTIVLDENYRSTQEVLDSANKMMQGYGTDWTYYPMKSANDLHANKPEILRAGDGDMQAKGAFLLIKELHDKGLAWQDIAVLVRGSRSSYELEMELSKNGIAFEKRGGLKFFDHACIRDMIALFKTIVNPADKIAWYRILMLVPGIGEKYGAEVSDIIYDRVMKGEAIDNDCVKNHSRRKYYKNLLKLFSDRELIIDNYNKLGMKGLYESASSWYNKVRDEAVSVGNFKNPTEEHERIGFDMQDIARLGAMMLNYKNIKAFIDEALLDAVPGDETHDKLVMSTIHSAKGLEWQAVIILDCSEGIFPPRHVATNTDDDYEELRCMYVAMTRAKEYLYIFSPMQATFFANGGAHVERVDLSRYVAYCRNSAKTYAVGFANNGKKLSKQVIYSKKSCQKPAKDL